ncbi:TonB-dependent receptor plug domain-containing protein [Tritonibacter mobilis]|uniref:TonB-dependent receptor plug domain-containing protein n=1 Tax=Tritonibacter mobilis TaxID=379347 RepID=UPI001CDA3A93|nr:TonB-dependent receptor [Tritonibacter mobilis]MCA2006699.1 TonB-dependent receptor [Tritonibacter mobilis]
MAAHITSTRALLACGTALTFMSTTPLWAQEAEVFSLDPIIVRQQDPFGEAADRATAVYVADAEIDRARMGDVKDLFAGIASAAVGGGIPVAQKIFVNGVDMLNLAIQLDGIPQNNRVFHHVSANAFDPGLMKSVRVDPGVAPADAGPQALAGRVVMETIDAEDFLDDGANFGGKAHLSYGDNGRTVGGALTLAARSAGFEILGYTRRMTGENYTDGDGRVMEGSGADLSATLLKLAYESAEGHRVEFSAQRLEDAAERNYRANFGPGAGTRFYDTARSTVSLRYENTLADGIWDPSVTIGYSETDVKTPVPYADDAKSRTKSITIANEFHLSDVSSITAGIDYQDKKNRYRANWISDAPFEQSKNTGIFAQARLQPTEHLKVSAGLRYDWMDFSDRYEANTSVSGASGNLSVVYQATESLSLRAGYSSVFGGINLEDNYLLGDTWDYSGLTETSRSDNIVVGIDWKQGGWTLGAELFQTEIENARGSTYNRTTSRYEASHYDFESSGFNIGATYDWGSGFTRLTYSNSKPKINGTEAGSFETLDLGAPLGEVIALEIQQSLPQYNLLVGGSLDMALDYEGQGIYTDQTFEGYEVVNLFAEYTPPALNGVTIRGSINNLFDQAYADRATYGGDYAGFSTLNEPGRTFVLEAIMRF